MNNDYNNNFEGDILKNIDAATSSVKKELTPLLDQKVKSESAIDHTMSLLDTDVINQEIIRDSLNNGHDQGQSNTKEKVRVRTIGGISPYGTVSSSSSDEHTDNNYSGIRRNYSSDDNPNVWRTGGYTETMILIGTGVLVLLVFMVSYLMLNYFG